LDLGVAGAQPALMNQGLPVFRINRGWLRRPRCSGHDCGAVLPKTNRTCPSCGGTVRGDVASAKEAEEAEGRIAAGASEELLGKLLSKGS
jgi:hypothetical protein